MKKLVWSICCNYTYCCICFTVIKSQDWKIADNYSVKFDGGDPPVNSKDKRETSALIWMILLHQKFDISVDVATMNTGNGKKNLDAKVW